MNKHIDQYTDERRFYRREFINRAIYAWRHFAPPVSLIKNTARGMEILQYGETLSLFRDPPRFFCKVYPGQHDKRIETYNYVILERYTEDDKQLEREIYESDIYYNPSTCLNAAEEHTLIMNREI